MRIGKTMAMVFASLSLFSSGALAEDAATNVDEFEIETIACWDVMTLPEDENAYVLLLLYGYSAGKQNRSTQSGEVIANTIGAAGKICGDHPDMPAIQAFTVTD